MAKVRSIGVFCGSAAGRDPAYGEAAAAAGKAIADAGVRLVYGGGDVGLMGIAAQAALDAKGKVLGVIPEFMIRREGLLEEAETRVVTTMSIRKNILIEESDAFLILPGGVGTLEEIFDVLSRQRLSQHDKPVAFLDVEAFWDPFFTLLYRTEKEGFTPDGFHDHVSVHDDAAEAVARLMQD
ncbi:TIGR00730 family Rossman fold protein [Hyphobacterium sp. HN65]|uniref:Cytokinin riboside 5'-monophosphate phosphoribohydrolase n=1 Tax=Hyphobacterium lacteum TaxID=3116575 RepID=A0ABU7LTA1_9PROT|nr:TIGR00730 family Rossman fold protein [Hyphobacterium sp. HN65]MEE2527100.1 TIGR00730 family Rossman fold protein [Hyphobacterium sp. HN65]